MGIIDAINSEDRIQIKFSDFYNLVKSAAVVEFLRNGINADVPHYELRKILTGKNDELEEYRKIGLSPDQIREMDQLFSEKCKEVATLNKEKDQLKRKLEDLTAQRKDDAVIETDFSVNTPTEEDDEEEPSEEPDAAADPETEQQRKRIDKGKIMALKKAGWKVKDIARDMGLKESAVSNVIYREKQKAEAQEEKGNNL